MAKMRVSRASEEPKSSAVRRPDLSEYAPQQLDKGKARVMAVLVGLRRMAKGPNAGWVNSVLQKYGKRPELMDEDTLRHYEELLEKAKASYERKAAATASKKLNNGVTVG